MKSVVIIGKGPSVLKSTKAFVDSFDEVAICNFPPMEKYQHLISNRAQYHFLNAGDPLPYSRDFLNGLGLIHIFNTSQFIHLPHWDTDQFMPDHKVFYYSDYGYKIKKEYEDKRGFWPSTGIMALDYFFKSEEHHKISLVGFDLMSPDKPPYYFPMEEGNPNHQAEGYIRSGHGDVDTQRNLIKELSKEKEIVWLQ